MTKEELKYYIDQDKKVAAIKTDFLHQLKHIFFPVYTFKYIKYLRKQKYYSERIGVINKSLSLYYAYRCHHMSKILGFYIPKDVFGFGLYIPHHGSIIVNPNSSIGNYCQINNNVVIGQIDGKCPTIGDNVFIGSGAVICGNISIANNVWIGANSVVMNDILEENVLVAGIPAKIVGKRKYNWVKVFLNNK